MLTFGSIKTGEHFTLTGLNIYRKIEPMIDTINYNAVIVSGSVAPFVLLGDNMPVKIVSNEVASKRMALCLP